MEGLTTHHHAVQTRGSGSRRQHTHTHTRERDREEDIIFFIALKVYDRGWFGILPVVGAETWTGPELSDEEAPLGFWVMMSVLLRTSK